MGFNSLIKFVIGIVVMLVIRSPLMMAIFGFLGGIYFAHFKPENATAVMLKIDELLIKPVLGSGLIN